MSKKPSFSVASRLKSAKQELQREEQKIIQTTILIESSLLYAAKEIALKRKKMGTKPDTITGMVKDALQEIVKKEGK